MLQALGIFVLVNDLYIGDVLEANIIKHMKYAYSSKTLLKNTLNNDRVNPLPSSMYLVIQSYSSIEDNAHNA